MASHRVFPGSLTVRATNTIRNHWRWSRRQYRGQLHRPPRRRGRTVRRGVVRVSRMAGPPESPWVSVCASSVGPTRRHRLIVEQERSIADAYLTWGWSALLDHRVVMVSQLFGRRRLGVRHSEQSTVLPVTLVGSRHSYHLISQPHAGTLGSAAECRPCLWSAGGGWASLSKVGRCSSKIRRSVGRC